MNMKRGRKGCKRLTESHPTHRFKASRLRLSPSKAGSATENFSLNHAKYSKNLPAQQSDILELDLTMDEAI